MSWNIWRPGFFQRLWLLWFIMFPQDYISTSMKISMKEHAYKNVIHKCDDCDLLAEGELRLEVHAEKKHAGNFECALCNVFGKNLEQLRDSPTHMWAVNSHLLLAQQLNQTDSAYKSGFNYNSVKGSYLF